jgi:hypothetical protein
MVHCRLYAIICRISGLKILVGELSATDGVALFVFDQFVSRAAIMMLFEPTHTGPTLAEPLEVTTKRGNYVLATGGTLKYSA